MRTRVSMPQISIFKHNSNNNHGITENKNIHLLLDKARIHKN